MSFDSCRDWTGKVGLQERDQREDLRLPEGSYHKQKAFMCLRICGFYLSKLGICEVSSEYKRNRKSISEAIRLRLMFSSRHQGLLTTKAWSGETKNQLHWRIHQWNVLHIYSDLQEWNKCWEGIYFYHLLSNIFGNWIGIGRAECQDKVLHDARYMFYCKTIKFQFIWKLKVGSETLIFKDNDEIN